MGEFKKTVVISPPRTENITEDTIYWKNLGFPVSVKDFGPIDYIDFSPANPEYFAVSCSSRVQIYSTVNNEVVKSLSRFRQAAYGGSFRSDGCLLAAGGDDGNVQLYDVKSKSLLRIFKGHKAPTHRSKFTRDGTKIISYSDDKTVGVWDIPTETKLISFEEHKDYIRAGSISQAGADIFISGSYDHAVKMYDARTSKCILSVNHNAPVESVLMFSSGSVFLSAGGTTINVWDAVAGRLFAQLSHHHKTITCLHFASENKRLMSGSLDRHVKIYDTMTYQVVHTLDYPSPILSLAVAPEDKVVAAGTTNALLSIRHQKRPVQQKEQKFKKRNKMLIAYHTTDMQFHSVQDDIVVHQKDVEKFSRYDKYLRSFQHSKALDAALQARKPEVTVSVIQELIRRQGIKAAVAGRNEVSLGRLLKFLIRYIGDPRFSMTLLDVALILIDIYAATVASFPETIAQFYKLKKIVDQEVTYMEELTEVLGAVNCIIQSSRDRKSVV